MKKQRIVKVKWIDTSTDDVWNDKNRVKRWAKDEVVVESVGFFIEKNKKNLLISSMMDNDSFGMSQKIPLGAIKSIKSVR